MFGFLRNTPGSESMLIVVSWWPFGKPLFPSARGALRAFYRVLVFESPEQIGFYLGTSSEAGGVETLGE